MPEGADTQGIIDRRDAALAQVRNMITDAFFSVSLPPWTPEKKPDWERALDAVSKIRHRQLGGCGWRARILNGGQLHLQAHGLQARRQEDAQRQLLRAGRDQEVNPPAGHLAALFKLLRDTPIPRERFVKHISLDNDWFKKRRLKVSTRADFAADEIASVNVRARYGQQPKNALLTSAQATAEFDWLSDVAPGGVMKRDVQVEYEVAFKNVDGAERPLKVVSAPKTVDVENVEIVPRELYAIAPVAVVSENFPWERYSSIEVHLRYTDQANGIAQKDLIRLTKEKPDAVWKMFVLDPSKNDFEYRIIFRALDNKDIERPWKTTDETQITVRNPFPTRRVVQVVPGFDWTQVAEAFVDLRYEDPENDVFVEESLSFKEGSASQAFSVDLRNPERKAVFYKVGVSFRDGRFLELPESITNERRISVRADMKGRRIVEIRPPVVFDQRRMRRVSAELRFEDFAAGLSFADAFVFESADGKGEFEYDYVDEARNRFEYRAEFLFENGLVQSTDWKASEASELVLNLP